MFIPWGGGGVRTVHPPLLRLQRGLPGMHWLVPPHKMLGKENKPLGTRPVEISLRLALCNPPKVDIHKMAAWEQPPP